jgi:hypothetical protein
MAVSGDKRDHPQQEQQYGNRHNNRKKQFRPARLRSTLHATAPIRIGLHRLSTPTLLKSKGPSAETEGPFASS